MKIADFDLSMRLIIRTTHSVECIAKIMGVLPNDNPQCISIATNPSENLWIFRKIYPSKTDLGQSIADFLSAIPEAKIRIRQVRQCGECTLRISLISEYGQFGFSLSTEDLQILRDLEIPVEVSIFSYGCC